MKLKRRLDCGLDGFNVPIIPKAPRSIRRRAHPRRAEDDSQNCAFELLASLARKLLQESESSSASSNASGNDNAAVSISGDKNIQEYEDKPVKNECVDLGSSEVSAIVSESQSQSCDQKCLLNAPPLAEDDDTLERSSKIMDSDYSGRHADDLKSIMCKGNIANGDFSCKAEGGSPNFGETCHNAMDSGFEKKIKTKGLGGSLKDQNELCRACPPLIKSDRDVKLQSCRDHFPGASFSSHRKNNTKVGSSDDDENLSRCNKLRNRVRVYRPGTRIGDRRIRKLLTSKYWKTAPKLKEVEHSRPDGGMKNLRRKRKTCYNHERRQHDSLFKRRKFYDRCSVMTFDGGFSCESVTNSPEKSRNGEKSGSASMSQGVGKMISSDSGDNNVKFSIKSFKVPEIFIEVSETATVGSLKRTVMDAMTSILGGGIRIGLLLHGKKIRDDNRTLLQTGLSSEDNLDTLGFTLEPSPGKAPPPVCSEEPPISLPSDTNVPHPVKRSAATPALDSGISDALTNPPLLTNPLNQVETNHEQANSHTEGVTDTTSLDSRALVAVPALNVEALAVVPLNQKTRRSELAQRRTRRPFSVAEVEALVQAVEELGTGRWRDVKLRSFEDADHRTYVDLKDKWKTLVHTARIAPQQRRGEPVPQELLDRVLAAHAYWSQHQAKQQGKHQTGILKLEAPAPANRDCTSGI